MFSETFKRSVSLLLALVMIFSVLPVTTMAAETTSHDHSGEEVAAGTDLQALQGQMDAILMEYLGATVLSEDEVIDIVNSMYWIDMEEAVAKLDALEASVTLSAEEVAQLEESYAGADTLVCFYEILQLAMTPSVFASSGTYTPVEGVTVGVSGATNTSYSDSDGVVTVTAEGSGGIFGFGASSKTATITVSNASADKKATISFDWTAESVNQLTIDGAGVSGTSGSFSKQMDGGASITITVTTAKNSTTNTLKLKNFAYAPQVESSLATINYNTALGSVKVGDTVVENGGEISVDATGVTLVATPVSGATFLGWIDTTSHARLSADAQYTLVAGDAETMAIAAAFGSASTSPWFTVGSSWYETLTEATANAASGTAIVPVCDGTLPAGNYTIPAGVTLLIPESASNTIRTTSPGTMEAPDSSTYYAPNFYRTLTMASGANIVVNGAISVAGNEHTNFNYIGAPGGDMGRIHMNSDSSITVNSGANLYAWGFISGSGSVLIKNGATVYEHFQAAEWHGGDVTNKIQKNSQRVFPVSQYYIQNVEVPMTLEAGAVEKVHMAADVTLVGIQTASFEFIGPSGLFRMSTGSITKDYDEKTDRMVFTLNGTGEFAKIQISIKVSTLGSVTIKSENFVFPLSNHVTLHIKSGSALTISNDISLLPSSEVIIENGATATLASGQSIYVYDTTEWVTLEAKTFSSGTAIPVGKGFVYPGQAQLRAAAYTTSRGKTSPRTAAKLVDAKLQIDGTLDTSKGYIYTTASGANICSSGGGTLIAQGPAASYSLYQMVQGGNEGKEYVFYSIPITAARLVQSSGYFATADYAGAVARYTYTNGAWNWECQHEYNETVTTAATCTAAGVKTFTCEVSKCGDSYTESIPATGHTNGAAVQENNVAATCTTDGSYDNVVYCTVCKAEVSREKITVNASGHSYEAVVTAPTCTEAGYTTYTCACGASYTADDVIALGHKYNAVVTAPTCTAGGYTTYTCASCGDTYIADEVAATGHAYEGVYTAPTANADGFTTYTCACGDYYVEVDEGTQLGAVAQIGNIKYETLTAAMAAAQEGDTIILLDKYTVEGDETWDLTGKTLVIPSVPENYGVVVKGNLTINGGSYVMRGCNGIGVSTTGTLTVNGGEFGYEGDSDYLIGNWNTTVINGGKFVGQYNCVNNFAGTLAINGGTFTTADTDCTGEYESADILGNAGVTIIGGTYSKPVEDDHLAEGYCSGAKENVYVVAVHSYEAAVIDPTCTAAGYTTHTCANCGDYYTDSETEALGHDMQKTADEIAPKCEVAGKEAVYTCASCGKTEGGEEIAALEHDMQLTSEKVEAKCEVAGKEAVYTCASCGKTEGGEEIAALEHDYNAVVTAPTCTEAGYTTHTCANCGDSYVDTYVDATNEHVDKDSDNKCDGCGEAMIAYKIESYASSLLLKGMIHIKQYWKFTGLTRAQVESGNAYMKVTEADGSTYTVDLDWYMDDTANGVTVFNAPTNGIPAKNMGENLMMQAFVKVDGVVYESAVKDYGVLTYAENMMKKDNEPLKSALVALLNYGAAAQIDLKYKTDDLANKDLQKYVDEYGLNPEYLNLAWTDDYLTSVVEPSEAMTANFVPAGTAAASAKSLYLKGAVSVNYYVTIGADNTKFDDSTATMYFWTAQQYAALENAGTALSKENASYVVENNDLKHSSDSRLNYYYTFLSDQIPAKNFGDTVYAVMCITDSDGVEHCTGMILYSPEVYAANKINNDTVETVDDVAKWMVVYGERAKIALA